MPASRTQRVWRAMAQLELEHGGPRHTTVTDICRKDGLSCPTIRKALHELREVGVVRRIGHGGNGNIIWQLDGPGRAKYRLPDSHAPGLKVGDALTVRCYQDDIERTGTVEAISPHKCSAPVLVRVDFPDGFREQGDVEPINPCNYSVDRIVRPSNVA